MNKKPALNAGNFPKWKKVSKKSIFLKPIIIDKRIKRDDEHTKIIDKSLDVKKS